jgi:hypothetical protein
MKSKEESKRKTIKRRLIKKRIKYREKQKKKKAALREELRLKKDGYPIPIKEARVEGQGDKPKDELSKKSIKTAASTLCGLTISSKIFQKMSNWRRVEKDLKNSDQSAGEKKLETNKLEELYSFKTMLRMLYQAGIIILRQPENAVVIPHVSFHVLG